MGLILLEALLALVLLIAIVWWTMFSGRTKGELTRDDPPADPGSAEDPALSPPPPAPAPPSPSPPPSAPPAAQ